MPTIINFGSEAWEVLHRMCERPDVHKISIDVREDGIALKANERTWTPTLSTTTKGV